MPKVALYNQSGSQVGEIDLADSVFGIEPNSAVLYDAIVMQQASQRQGTHDVKNRSEVRGGGRKPWRQKGTGRARQGSIRSPQWKGGGVVFGPTPRKYGYKLNRKVRRLALKSALSAKVQSNEILVLEALNIAAPKTKEMTVVLNNLKADRKVLIVTSEYDQNVALASRNIPGAKIVDAAGINVLDLVAHDKVIVTKEAIAKVEEVLA
ncbi:50S ribosomal protein L4 [Brevibacillus porteri]|uniref:Large ribosomal subunit protein uL4 n=2 Tax=Brevibacillus TaxID=55080 RepID=A0A1Y4X5Y8_BREBE|nr:MULTISPECIES: 50S ribosomal protein L4 [Brevibacillus]EJL32474.1 50S ribosomal protein L4, bacterial/organelle [Brevibacillus sp. BC25]MBH0328548.1 50S ribosomal protein L4 [Brevibacillus brevis]MED1781129.1 50S ribosomal protein L4 [Brevibacillus fortis]OUQ90139.1 50S ribosomal protein L4 [Brevibacillus brevis]PSJ88463.1 50S ribosomal protein L4 [Brevibacillus fortis]